VLLDAGGLITVTEVAAVEAKAKLIRGARSGIMAELI
jgi:hypothetical protein